MADHPNRLPVDPVTLFNWLDSHSAVQHPVHPTVVCGCLEFAQTLYHMVWLGDYQTWWFPGVYLVDHPTTGTLLDGDRTIMCNIRPGYAMNVAVIFLHPQ